MQPSPQKRTARQTLPPPTQEPHFPLRPASPLFAVPQKNDRAEQSRINGAKSRGPKTPSGQHKARTATLAHGLYAKEPNLLPTVDEPAFLALRQSYIDAWHPANSYVADKVADLASFRWELNRLRAARSLYFSRMFSEISATSSPAIADSSFVLESEINVSTASGTFDRFDLRLRRIYLEMSRVERDILRVRGHLADSGPSQNTLKTNEHEPETTQQPEAPSVAWAENNLDFDLDLHQAELLAATGPRVLLKAARYTGKTTALALRAVHESVHNPEAVIACLSPNTDLANKVAETAAAVGHQPANISAAVTPHTTLILVDDAADLPAGQLNSLNPQAVIIAAATPNGSSGYFFDKWHSGLWTRIDAPAAQCDFIHPDLLQAAFAELSEAAYLQEFEAHFLNVPQPRCNFLPVAQ